MAAHANAHKCSARAHRTAGKPSASERSIAIVAPLYGVDFVDCGMVADAPLQKREDAAGGTHQPIASSGHAGIGGGLPPGLRAGIAALSGMDLSNVRVHANSSRPSTIGALAFAQGNDIHLGPGQERHLPHEAWHVVQQRQGRVKPSVQMRGMQVNADSALEREADVMGDKAAHAKRGDEIANAAVPLAASLSTSRAEAASSSDAVVQPRLGFEIEMLALVDINGRPIPEKVELGTTGAHNVEMTVDHGQAVAAPTPTPAYRANFSVPGMVPGIGVAPPGPLLLGPYDTPVGTETRMHLPVGIDPRAAAVPNLLVWNNWTAATAGIDRTRTQNPDNRPIVQIDQILQQYDYQRLYDNHEAGTAQLVLAAVRTQAVQWRALNPHAVHRFGHPWSNAHRTARHNSAIAQVNAIEAEAIAQSGVWTANPNPAVGMVREYRQPVGGGGGMGAWGAVHPRFQPQEGMGTDRYASILELVTPGGPGYEPETLAGRTNIIAAMTEAANFAAALEAATHHFAQRVPLASVAGVNNVTHPGIHVGNVLQPGQTTDASIQATMAIDLAQIASFIKSTVAASNRSQTLFELKHHSDPVGQHFEALPPRSETEMARAPLVARNIIRNRLNGVAGWNGNVTHLRGLITLIAQYLLMGKHFFHPGSTPLDKNIVPLLSRNDLGAVIFNEMVPPAEKVLVNTGAKRNVVVAAILAETGRLGARAVFNRADDSLVAAAQPQPPFDLSCTRFIRNVLTGQPDGITANLGGFRQFAHGESVDPGAARGGDYRRVGAAQREGAIFEMRNMIPSEALNLPEGRLPHAQWVTLATYMSNLLAALNARNVAASATDTRYRQATGLTVNENAPW